MDSVTDQQLLRDYSRSQSEESFAKLVHRHVDLVYSVALRIVQDSHLAQEVTQSAFLALAQNARKLEDRPVLCGWLHGTTRNLASKVVRAEVRRRAREREATSMNEMRTASSNDVWTDIAPHLDSALGDLTDVDRDALLLRYFENKKAREIAEILGVSEEAAQKRVNRAIERLRDIFAQQGITVGGSTLALALSANALSAAPAGLAVAVSATVTAGGSPLIGTLGASKAIAMTTLQKVLVTTTIAIGLSLGVYKSHQASTRQAQIRALQQERATLSAQIQQLNKQSEQVRSALDTLAEQLAKAKGTPDELLRLRGEVTRLRNAANQANDPFVRTALTWKQKENRLRKLFQDYPEQNIPELRLLSEQAWLNAAMNADLDTETGRRQAMSGLRQGAENQFVIKLHDALQNYMQTNNGQSPTSLTPLESYFEPSLAQALTQRYELRPALEFPTHRLGGEWYITQKSPIDSDYDLRWIIGENGFGNTPFKAAIEEQALAPALTALDDVVKAYAAANNGRQPTDPTQLQPFIATTAQQAALQQVLQYRATNRPSR